MSDDLKNMIESNVESYAASVRTHISWMRRDIEALECIGNRLIENPNWDYLLEALNYLEIIQHSNSKCNDLIHRAMENREILKQYSERYGNDE